MKNILTILMLAITITMAAQQPDKVSVRDSVNVGMGNLYLRMTYKDVVEFVSTFPHLKLTEITDRQTGALINYEIECREVKESPKVEGWY